MALVNTIGTEFGEIDRPSRGGYTEPGWNKGAFGADLTGTDNEGFALPPSVLKPYGYGQKDFAENFNKNYDIRVVNPQTGQSVTGPLKDIGPAPGADAGIDILWGSRAKLGFDPNFKGNVQYEIVPKGTAAASTDQTSPAYRAALQQAQQYGGPLAASAVPGTAVATAPTSPASPAPSYLASLAAPATGDPQLDRINQLLMAMRLSSASQPQSTGNFSADLVRAIGQARAQGQLEWLGIGPPRAQLVA